MCPLLPVRSKQAYPTYGTSWYFKNQSHAKIFIHLRLSRALLAFLVGASLSLSGAILQGYFQNPMAGPFVVGVSSGASFGAVLAIILGLNMSFWGFSMQNLFAFGSGFAIVSLVYILSQRKGVFKVETLLLTGIAAGALASSLTSFLIFFKSESFERAVFWLLGSFYLADWNHIRVVFPYFILCLIISQWLAKDMNLLVLGDEIAQSLGCSVNKTRKIFLIVSTLLASSSVSVSGIIGFVGLIIPHWVRLLIGPDHRYLFFSSSDHGRSFSDALRPVGQNNSSWLRTPNRHHNCSSRCALFYLPPQPTPLIRFCWNHLHFRDGIFGVCFSSPN